jgi:hypothetical protein
MKLFTDYLSNINLHTDINLKTVDEMLKTQRQDNRGEVMIHKNKITRIGVRQES